MSALIRIIVTHGPTVVTVIGIIQTVGIIINDYGNNNSNTQRRSRSRS